MIKALAPGMRRGCSWVWLSIVLGGTLPSAVLAQPPAKKDATKPADPKKDTTKPADTKAATGKAADDKAAAGKAAEEKPEENNAAPEGGVVGEDKSAKVEVFKDPNAEAAREIFKAVPGLKQFKASDVKSVIGMAASGPVDRDLLQRFVRGMAFELVDKANINAVIDPPDGLSPNANSVRAVQRATDNLLEAFNTAKLAKNTSFLSAYVPELLDTLPKLLDNNLVSRLMASIVLGQVGSPNAIPIYLNLLKDPKQTVWVKLWAARGLSNASETGVAVDPLGAQANEAGKVLSNLLDSEPDLPWPVQLRALEALGSMRQAATLGELQKVAMASTAMTFLADRDARPEVRATAAWALGMLRVNNATAKYNHYLIAYDIGQLATEIGEKINSSIDGNPTLSQYLTALLITPIYQAFSGTDRARESGLLKVPGGSPNMPAIRQVADLTQAMTKDAVELVRAPRGQIAARKKDLGDRVAELKSYLAKNPPKEYTLVPNGKVYRPAQAEVAKAPVEKLGAAGAPNGK